MEALKRKSLFLDYLLTGLGTAILAAAIHFFFIPHELVTGGFSGIGIIVNYYSQNWAFAVPVWMTNIVLSVPLVLIALKVVGFKYMTKTIFAIGVMTLVLFLLDMLPYDFVIETDLLLASVFGGVMCGVGMAIVLRREATTGGSTLVADLIHRLVKRFSTPRVLMVLDWAVILGGLFVFGTERTMYALIAIFICTVAMEYFTKWPRFTKAVFIITNDAKNVGTAVMEKMNHGVTSLDGHGVYTGAKKNILLCVIYDSEVAKIKKVVSEIDESAFMIVTEAQEVLGEGFERIDK